jgi:hypothetical protein
MKNAMPWRDSQGKKDGARRWWNTSQPLTTIKTEL